jgi:hypothetical protein
MKLSCKSHQEHLWAHLKANVTRTVLQRVGISSRETFELTNLFEALRRGDPEVRASTFDTFYEVRFF